MLANLERRDHLVLRDLRDPQAHLDLQDLLEQEVLLDHQACQVLGAALGLKVSRVKVENREPVAIMENVVLLDPKVFLANLVQLVNQGGMETQDQMVNQDEMDPLVARVIVVKMVLLVPRVLLAIQGHLVLSVQLGRVVTEEKRVLLVLLVLRVLLELGALLVPKVHEVTKVKLVSVAPMASKDTEDSQAIQVPQVPLVLQVTRVQLVVPDLPVPEDQLDHMGLLEKMVQADIRVPLGRQDLEATEVKEDLRAHQATLGNQGPLDLLVHLVLAVVEEVLPPLEVVKSLLDLHPTMAMNQWISRSTPRKLCLPSSLLMDK